MNETFCAGSVTYTTTVEPSDGNVTMINETMHNITELKASTLYTINVSTLQPTSKHVAINIHHILIV